MMNLGLSLERPPFTLRTAAQVVQELFKYDSTLITKPDDTRAIKNEGSAPNSDLALFSGQGLEFTGNEYIKTGVGINSGYDHTILISYIVPPDGRNHDILGKKWAVQATAAENGITLRNGGSSGIYLGFGESKAGQYVTVAISRNHAGLFVNAYCSFGRSSTKEMNSFNASTDNIAIGGRLETNDDMGTATQVATTVKDIAAFKEFWTQEQFDAYVSDPEGLLFWEGNTAKSRHLAQPAIGALVAGEESFIYRLNEGVNFAEPDVTKGSYAQNLARPLGGVNASVDRARVVSDATTTVNIDEVTGTIELNQNGATGAAYQPACYVDNFNRADGELYLIEVEISTDTEIVIKGFRTQATTDDTGGNITCRANEITKVSFVGNYRDNNSIAVAVIDGTVYTNFNATITYKVTKIEAKPIVGMIDAAPRTNAQSLPYGTQNALLTDDLRGLLPSGQFRFDGASNMQLPPVTLPSDYCIDLVLHRGEYSGSNQFVLQDSDNKIYIYMNPTNRRLYYRFSNQYPYADGGNNIGVGESIVITFEVAGSELKLYHNGEFMATYSITPITGFGTIFLGSRNNGSDKLRGIVADFSILPETRTDEERAEAVGALMTKHGVT